MLYGKTFNGRTVIMFAYDAPSGYTIDPEMVTTPAGRKMYRGPATAAEYAAYKRDQADSYLTLSRYTSYGPMGTVTYNRSMRKHGFHNWRFIR